MILGLVFLLFTSSKLVFADGSVFFGGSEGGGGDSINHYTHFGVISPITEKSIRNGLTQRYYIDLYGYEFEEAESIKVLRSGIEGSLGYHKSGEIFSGSVYIGLRYNYADLSPDVPDSTVRGHNVWLKTHFAGEANLSESLTLSLMGSYTFGLDGFWSRGRLMNHLKNGLSVGPEIEFMGDTDYQAWKMGIVVTGFEPIPGVIVGLNAGIRKTLDAGSNANIGIEITKF